MPDTLTYDLRDGLAPISAVPAFDAAELELAPFGTCDLVGMSAGDNGTLAFKDVRRFRGIGLTAGASGRILESYAVNNWTGAKMLSSDGEIRGCMLAGNRDVCLWISRDAGNVQSSNNHCFGARVACLVDPCGQFRSVEDTFADSLIGLHYEAWEGTIIGALFQHNMTRAAVLRGNSIELSACTFNIQREVKLHSTFDVGPGMVPGMRRYERNIGIEVQALDTTISGGRILLDDFVHPANEVTGLPTTAMIVNADGFAMRETRLIDGHRQDGTIGIRLQSLDSNNGVPIIRKNCSIDCHVRGFHEPHSKVLVIDNADRCQGLDITIRFDDELKKPVGEYFAFGKGLTGNIRAIVNGAAITLASGSVH